MLDLTGKTALVTGAGSGMGLGIAHQLSSQGAHVIVNDIVAAKAESGAEQIIARGCMASASVWDVTDADAVKASIGNLEDSFGAIDILVNNAGNAGAVDMVQAAFRDSVPENWRKFVDVNLYGVMHCTHAVLPGMCERGWGRVITISSAAGRTGLNIGVSVYGAAKAGSINLMRHISQEVGRHGVTCNAIALGLMDTVPEEFARHIIPSIPCGRLGTAEDAGYMTGFLASEEAGWITGQLFCVDGGAAPF
ncbi:SDR family oxidoreductase [Seongchinamella unica]|uniref:SDR family oxidoreductase n=1 Tax=Seongchinamella unica TaxID=2547392 RepID=A0A4R5LS56_9GAMM|nr:SDR family NAD(P)-dependent oxidoreductase [Seongchinamella unica]TDG13729.1 SDR family oxidoreductase [Seongchinamella unica]